MPGLFDRQAIDISCAKCGNKHAKSVAWLKSHRYLVCPCGARTLLNLRDFLGPLKKVEDSIKKFPRQMTIRIGGKRR